MAQCEIKRVNKLIEETSASSETSSRKKKELKLIIERLKVESETHAKEMSALQSNSELIKRQLEHAEAEKENFRKSLEESTEKINAVVESLQQANNMVEDYKNRLKKNDEQIEFLELELKTSSRLREEKELIEAEIAKLCFKVPNNGDFRNSDESSPQSLKQLAEIKRHLLNYDDLEKKLEGEKRDVLQLRKFNKELTEQFNSQMDIIVELKKRYLDLNAKVRNFVIT
jgi:chromosome segregation ATPase